MFQALHRQPSHFDRQNCDIAALTQGSTKQLPTAQSPCTMLTSASQRTNHRYKVCTPDKPGESICMCRFPTRKHSQELDLLLTSILKLGVWHVDKVVGAKMRVVFVDLQGLLEQSCRVFFKVRIFLSCHCRPDLLDGSTRVPDTLLDCSRHCAWNSAAYNQQLFHNVAKAYIFPAANQVDRCYPQLFFVFPFD